MTQKSVTILGATGSIGRSTLDLVGANTERFPVVALTAHDNVDLLIAQSLKHKPQIAVIGNETHHAALREALAPHGIETAAGAQAVIDAAARPSDMVVAGIVGVAGLAPTYAAIKRGAQIAFANKECLVSAGTLMMDAVAKYAAVLLPIDSEHNAIFQVFDTANRDGIRKLILTASGGPFLKRGRETLSAVTPAEAVKHPNWSMGAKISIDSATMMNKALELIEARYLFDMPADMIDVVIHPQSIVHSMVEYADGSVLAQMGASDMRTPIAYALAWPSRMETTGARLDFAQARSLDFIPLDTQRFPAIGFARSALFVGRNAPCILNAANETAVAAFLAGRIRFTDIERIVEKTLEAAHIHDISSLDAVFAAHADALRLADGFIEDFSHGFAA